MLNIANVSQFSCQKRCIANGDGVLTVDQQSYSQCHRRIKPSYTNNEAWFQVWIKRSSKSNFANFFPSCAFYNRVIWNRVRRSLSWLKQIVELITGLFRSWINTSSHNAVATALILAYKALWTASVSIVTAHSLFGEKNKKLLSNLRSLFGSCLGKRATAVAVRRPVEATASAVVTWAIGGIVTSVATTEFSSGCA